MELSLDEDLRGRDATSPAFYAAHRGRGQQLLVEGHPDPALSRGDDVVLTIDVDHPRPSDLVLSIDNFNGYGETLWLNDSSPEAQIVVRAFPSDDMVNGQYNVRLTDTVAGEIGTLRGWDLYIVSNWD